MRTQFLFLAFLIAFNTNAVSQITQYSDKKGNAHLLGHIEQNDLKAEPYSVWYNEVYDKYELDTETIKMIDKYYSDDIKIKIYLGTWCGDSKREVSRFLKIMAHSKIKLENIELICLDARSETYKQGPNGEGSGIEYSSGTHLFIL